MHVDEVDVIMMQGCPGSGLNLERMGLSLTKNRVSARNCKEGFGSFQATHGLGYGLEVKTTRKEQCFLGPSS